MTVMPNSVMEAWKNREGPMIFATVDGDGTPNIIYVASVALYGEDRLVVADNYFDKTLKNIKAGSRGAALFMTSDKKPYQLKGTIEYHESGALFDDMKKWNPPKHPGRGAVALVVKSIYSGSKRIAP